MVWQDGDHWQLWIIADRVQVSGVLRKITGKQTGGDRQDRDMELVSGHSSYAKVAMVKVKHLCLHSKEFCNQLPVENETISIPAGPVLARSGMV